MASLDKGDDTGAASHFALVEGARRAADLLKALAHGSRISILCLLSEGETSVSELSDRLHMSQSSVSQQLMRLRWEGLVASRREGKRIYYELADSEARRVIDALHQMFCGEPLRSAKRTLPVLY